MGFTWVGGGRTDFGEMPTDFSLVPANYRLRGCGRRACLIFEMTIIFYPFNFIDMKKLCALISNVYTWWLEWITSSSSSVSNKTRLLGLVVVLVLLLFMLLFRQGDASILQACLSDLVSLGALLLFLVGKPLLEVLWEKSVANRKTRDERFWVPLVAAKLIYAALELKTGLGYVVVGIVISYAYLLYQERKMVGQGDRGATT